MSKQKITLTRYTCLRCNYRWIPRKEGDLPIACPWCNSRQWNVPRNKKKHTKKMELEGSETSS